MQLWKDILLFKFNLTAWKKKDIKTLHASLNNQKIKTVQKAWALKEICKKSR